MGEKKKELTHYETFSFCEHLLNAKSNISKTEGEGGSPRKRNKNIKLIAYATMTTIIAFAEPTENL